MKPLDQTVRDAFLAEARRRGVAAGEVWDYVKWLRYYLDFCDKYRRETLDRDSLQAFLLKLASKNQSAEQQAQAARSVRLYLELAAPRAAAVPAVSAIEPRAAPPAPPPAAPAAFTPQAAPPAQPRPPAGAKPAVIVGGARPDRVAEPKAPWPGASPWDAVIVRIKEEVKVRQYSPKTFDAYAGWVRQFAGFAGKPPDGIVMQDVKDFLTHLAVDERVVASTQNQAFNALLFLFRHVFKKEFDAAEGIVRARRKRHIPVVLSSAEVEAVVAQAAYPYGLVIGLLYGCGLRLFECLNLRVQCFNFDDGMLTVHDGKGKKDRTVPLPKVLVPELRAHLARVGNLYRRDLRDGFGGVFLPGALERKYRNAPREWIWQWFFPAKTLTLVPETGARLRYHLHESHVQKAIHQAAGQARITKRVTAHTFRHTFASHLLLANYDIRTIQEMLGHSDVRTTMIYTHTVPSRTQKERASPLDLGACARPANPAP
ncbi:MAG TPA: integron integrase [Planctomycetota bacterium]|nr:integron integrase [Planctomycetota bacterium]HRT97615.1 integron integrase [Planctomycetota bacterium]